SLRRHFITSSHLFHYPSHGGCVTLAVSPIHARTVMPIAPPRPSVCPDERVRESADALAEALSAVGRDFYQRGWVPATSGNFSVVLRDEPRRLLATASGKHKGRLHVDDFLVLDGDGRPAQPTSLKPSAEVALHLALTEQEGVGAVL